MRLLDMFSLNPDPWPSGRNPCSPLNSWLLNRNFHYFRFKWCRTGHWFVARLVALNLRRITCRFMWYTPLSGNLKSWWQIIRIAEWVSSVPFSSKIHLYVQFTEKCLRTVFKLSLTNITNISGVNGKLLKIFRHSRAMTKQLREFQSWRKWLIPFLFQRKIETSSESTRKFCHRDQDQ